MGKGTAFQNNDSINFDPTSLILSSEDLDWLKATRETTRAKRQQVFIKLPFERSLRIAKAFHSTGVTIWLALLRTSFAQRGANPVRLNNRYLEGIDRRSKYESLKLLEKLGEVQIQRQKGKSPLVTICCLPLKATAAAPGGGH